jgi:dihydropteroate synthase
MQSEPRYDDVVTDVAGFLRERMAACIAGGIPRENIVLDPGFGFGKTHAHNLELLARLAELTDLGRPLLVGLSRKSTLGALTGKDVDDRLGASIAAAVIAVMAGAAIIRAHDVEETVDALRVTAAIVREKQDL